VKLVSIGGGPAVFSDATLKNFTAADWVNSFIRSRYADHLRPQIRKRK
jgi:hypothetical protein